MFVHSNVWIPFTVCDNWTDTIVDEQQDFHGMSTFSLYQLPLNVKHECIQCARRRTNRENSISNSWSMRLPFIRISSCRFQKALTRESLKTNTRAFEIDQCMFENQTKSSQDHRFQIGADLLGEVNRPPRSKMRKVHGDGTSGGIFNTLNCAEI